jgi:hypothetical protein
MQSHPPITRTLTTVAETVVSVAWFSVSIFIVAAVILLCGSVLMLARGYLLADAFRLSLGVVMLGFGGSMVYEAWAIATGRDTISHITELAFIASPIVWVSLLCALMLLEGALVIHFTRVEHRIMWWPAGIGLLAWLVGVVSSALSTWEP